MEMIRVIKLVTGEDVIGLVSEQEKLIVIKKPFLLMTRPVEDSMIKFQLGFMPWAPYADKYTVPIIKDKIVSVFNPDPNLLSEYEKILGKPEPETSTPEFLQE